MQIYHGGQQGISSDGIDLVLSEYPGFSNRKTTYQNIPVYHIWSF